jgi:hypothetical protein
LDLLRISGIILMMNNDDRGFAEPIIQPHFHRRYKV